MLAMPINSTPRHSTGMGRYFYLHDGNDAINCQRRKSPSLGQAFDFSIQETRFLASVSTLEGRVEKVIPSYSRAPSDIETQSATLLRPVIIQLMLAAACGSESPAG